MVAMTSASTSGSSGFGPRCGDIGEPLKHIELEPVEVPLEVPQPEEVPSR